MPSLSCRHQDGLFPHFTSKIPLPAAASLAQGWWYLPHNCYLYFIQWRMGQQQRPQWLWAWRTGCPCQLWPCGTTVYADSRFAWVLPRLYSALFPCTNTLYIIPISQPISHAVCSGWRTLALSAMLLFSSLSLVPISFSFLSIFQQSMSIYEPLGLLAFMTMVPIPILYFARHCYRLFTSKRQGYDHDRREKNFKAKGAQQQFVGSSK